MKREDPLDDSEPRSSSLPPWLDDELFSEDELASEEFQARAAHPFQDIDLSGLDLSQPALSLQEGQSPQVDDQLQRDLRSRARPWTDENTQDLIEDDFPAMPLPPQGPISRQPSSSSFGGEEQLIRRALQETFGWQSDDEESLDLFQEDPDSAPKPSHEYPKLPHVQGTGPEPGSSLRDQGHRGANPWESLSDQLKRETLAELEAMKEKVILEARQAAEAILQQAREEAQRIIEEAASKHDKRDQSTRQ